MDLDAYADWLASAGLSSNTIAQRRRFANGRLNAWGTLDVPSHVAAKYLLGFTGWTKCTYYEHLNSIYQWMIETGQVETSPIARVKRPTPPNPRPSPIPFDLLRQAYETAPGHLGAWIMLGALAGLRCHEIAKFHGRDITEDRLVVLGKGGLLMSVPTNPELWEIAQKYPTDDYWFPSDRAGRDYLSPGYVRTLLGAHLATVGVTGRPVHRLRHTYITNLSRAGVRMRVVQELARHASIQTTMGYDAVEESERQEGIRALPRLAG